MTNLDLMANDQFPMTKCGGVKRYTVEITPDRRIRHWSLVIGIWSFPQDPQVVLANNAG
jgi:hypothetical protein